MFDKIFDFGDDDSTDAETQREWANNPDGLTKLQRQRPNGQLTPHDSPDAPDAPNAVDRGRESGRFVSKDRDPVPFVRDRETGRLEADAFAIGNFDAATERDRR